MFRCVHKRIAPDFILKSGAKVRLLQITVQVIAAKRGNSLFFKGFSRFRCRISRRYNGRRQAGGGAGWEKLP